MPIKINGDTYYRTVEVCRLAGISRATLFRWLKDGVMGEEEVRDRRGWRLFSQEQVNRIKAEASKTTSVAPKKPRRKPAPLSILVVDDEPIIGTLLKNSLQPHGHKVTTALNGHTALGLLNKKRFDLVFLDLVMQVIDGAEVFRRIRAKDKTLPVAIITGYPDSDLMAKALEYGPFVVMKKPFDTMDILETVRRISVGSR